MHDKHRSTLLGDLHIFSGLIKGLNAFLDMDPLDDFVPDYALIDEDTAVNTPHKIPVITDYLVGDRIDPHST